MSALSAMRCPKNLCQFSRADTVIVNDTLCAVAMIDPQFIELQPLGGEASPLSFSHPELLGLLTEGGSSVEYGYFSGRQAARRAMAGRGLLALLSKAEQQLLFWKIDWCETFLVAEAQGDLSRSDKSGAAFIPELERRIVEQMRRAAGNGPRSHATA